MNVDMIFKIAAVGILVAVINIVLSRAGREEYVMLTTLAGVIMVLLMLVGEIKTLFDTLHSVFNF
jgi:stage III sporulation protein AC